MPRIHGVETVDRRDTPRGELVLRHDPDTGRYEIISNGTFLMDTSDGRSERLLITAALDAAPAPYRVLIGGLGVGFSLNQAVSDPRPTAVTVFEREQAVVDWQHEHLAPFSGHALTDPRVRVVVADLVAWAGGATETYDAICLDIDNGPEWTVVDGNAALYTVDGLTTLRGLLSPGGVLAVWSAAAAPAFADRLAEVYGSVAVHEIPVPRGEPDVVYLAS